MSLWLTHHATHNGALRKMMVWPIFGFCSVTIIFLTLIRLPDDAVGEKKMDINGELAANEHVGGLMNGAPLVIVSVRAKEPVGSIQLSLIHI